MNCISANDAPAHNAAGHTSNTSFQVPPSILTNVATSQNGTRGHHHIEIPTANWDQRTTRKSFLDLSDSYRVPDADFFRRAGIVDRRTWRRVRRQYDTGYVT